LDDYLHIDLAIIELLIEKGILDRDEVLTALERLVPDVVRPGTGIAKLRAELAN
jgi:hypothetical protein